MKRLLLMLSVLALAGLSFAETEPDAGDDGTVVPDPTPEPPLTFEQVLDYRQQWEDKQEEYLAQNGWTRGTDTPGKFFFWQLAYKGIEYRLEADQAMYVQRGISEEREQEALERQAEQSIGI